MRLNEKFQAARCHVINGLCDLVERYDNEQCWQQQKKLTKRTVMDQINQYLYSVGLRLIRFDVSFPSVHAAWYCIFSSC